MKTGHQWSGERGSALLSVLLIVFMMASISLMLSEQAQKSLRLAALGQSARDDRWLLKGAGEVAATLIEAEIRNTGRLDSARHEFTNAGLTAHVKLSERPNCFNLNAIASIGADGMADEAQLAAFQRLLLATGVDDNEAAAASNSLADWIDADDVSRPEGAESGVYQIKDEPYAAANRPLISVDELFDIKGFAPELVAKIRKYVCIEEAGVSSSININALKAEEWPVIRAVLPSVFADTSALADFLVRYGPDNAWSDGAQFRLATANPLSAGEPDPQSIAQLVVQPVRATATVTFPAELKLKPAHIDYQINETGRAFVTNTRLTDAPS
jgi:general secretion pathway protein K